MTLHASKTRHKNHYRRSKFDEGRCKSCGRWDFSNKEGWNNFGNDMYLDTNDSFHLSHAEYTSSPPVLSLQNDCFRVDITGETFHKLVRTILDNEAVAVSVGKWYHHILGLPYDEEYKTKKKIREFHRVRRQEEYELQQARKKYQRQLKKERENERATS